MKKRYYIVPIISFTILVIHTIYLSNTALNMDIKNASIIIIHILFLCILLSAISMSCFYISINLIHGNRKQPNVIKRVAKYIIAIDLIFVSFVSGFPVPLFIYFFIIHPLIDKIK